MPRRRKKSSTKSRSSVPLEFYEQVGFLNWFEDKFPGVRIFAIPNGEKRSISVAKRLKKEGVKKGVPDLYIPAFKVWVEMKRVKGSVTSKEQKEWHAYLRNIGDTVILAKGATDASRQIMDYIKDNYK